MMNMTMFTHKNAEACSFKFVNRVSNVKKDRYSNRPIRGNDGKAIYTDSKAVHFTVVADILPCSICLDGALRPVSPYQFPTNHCTKCLDYSHHAKACNYKGPRDVVTAEELVTKRLSARHPHLVIGASALPQTIPFGQQNVRLGGGSSN